MANQRLIGLLTYCAYHHRGQWDWRYRFLSNHVSKGAKITHLDRMIPEALRYYKYLVERFEKK